MTYTGGSWSIPQSPVGYGSGISDHYTGSNAIINPQVVTVAHGSDANPVTSSGPTMRISRVENLLLSTVNANGGIAGTVLTNEASAALVLEAAGHSAAGPAGTNMQTNALFAYAFNDGPGTWDAVTIQSVGRTMGGSTRRATGLYAEGRKDNDSGLIGTCELRVTNNNPTNDAAQDSTYNAAGASNIFALLLSAATTLGVASPTLAAGMQFTSTDGTSQWGVGIGFCTTAIATNDIRSDSHATTSINLNGTYSVAGLTIGGTTPIGINLVGTYSAASISVGQTSNAIDGPVLIGGNTIQNAGAFFEVQGPATSFADPLAVFGRTDTTQKYSIYLRNSSGSYNFGVCGGAGDFLTGTAAGDGVLIARSSSKTLHMGGTTKVVSVTQANTLGFFAATPVAKQTSAGNTTTTAAGSTTNVFTNTTFPGASGATAYTVGDIVTALKAYGLLTA